MGTSDSTDRKRGGVIEMRSRSHSQPMKHGTRLAAAGFFLLGGCLDLLGEVNVDNLGQDTLENLPGDCGDAGLAAGTCVVQCDPGVPRCKGTVLQRCNETGDGW